MALFLFNKVLTPAQFTLPDNQELSLNLGATTIVQMTCDRSLTFIGLAATGGNFDGMTVCFSHIDVSNSFTLSFSNENVGTSSPANRFRNPAGNTISGGTGIGAVWYRYNGTLQRWVCIGKSV
ncbi:MAG TPA: hypothetical protein VFT22_07390 [Kofleriaceae bacterium]|nr:hypothetical protein [Kofleriaceae bacterium]